jgi:phosphatidylglycerol:prolipoprotein diacylglycerol transferase
MNNFFSSPILIPEFDPEIFAIGPIALRWYSLAYVIGILIGYFFIKKNNQIQKKISAQAIDNFIPYIVFSILLGGRLGYVIFYNLEYFIKNPFEILAFWHGGMSFHGGLIGVIIGMILFSKNYRISFFYITDQLAIITPIGIFLGRIANFINLELYGRVTDSKFGVIFPNTDGLPRHPSQIYEALLEGLVLGVILLTLFYLTNAKKKIGLLSGIFLACYGFFRILLENFREPDQQIGFIFTNFTMGQILSYPLIIIGIIIIIYSLKKIRL